MTARRFMVGDKVALSETPAAPLGEVATFQDVGDRQILRVRDDAGQLHAVVVQLSPETSEVIAGPMSLDEVRAIARAALSSGARIPSGLPFRVPFELSPNPFQSAFKRRPHGGIARDRACGGAIPAQPRPPARSKQRPG